MFSKRFWLLAFIPLMLSLAAVLAIANDATHPRVDEDHCIVLGLGLAASPFKLGVTPLYAQGADPLHDVAFQCSTRGRVWLNEPNPVGTVTQPGSQTKIIHRRYQYLPEQWRIWIASQPHQRP